MMILRLAVQTRSHRCLLLATTSRACSQWNLAYMTHWCGYSSYMKTAFRKTSKKKLNNIRWQVSTPSFCVCNLEPCFFTKASTGFIKYRQICHFERNLKLAWAVLHIQQWNLSNLYTLGTISGVHFMEVSWFQGLVKMQCSIWDHNKWPEYGGVLISGVKISEGSTVLVSMQTHNALFGVSNHTQPSSCPCFVGVVRPARCWQERGVNKGLL